MYNGWTNYETWAVNLWMSNDESSQLFFDEMVKHALRTAVDGEEIAIGSLERELKCYFDHECPDLGATVWADLLGAALSEVNWHEIATHLINDIK